MEEEIKNEVVEVNSEETKYISKGKCIAAFVCALCGLCLDVSGFVALALGIVAVVLAAKSKNTKGSPYETFNKIAKVIGIIVIVLSAISSVTITIFVIGPLLIELFALIVTGFAAIIGNIEANQILNIVTIAATFLTQII